MDKEFKFSIENFRIFKTPLEIEFLPITILTGPNNSGKTTVIKWFQLLTNAFKKDLFHDLNFADPTINLGNFNKVINNTSQKKDIQFDIDNWTFSYVKHSRNNSYAVLNNLMYSINKKKRLFNVQLLDESKIKMHDAFLLQYNYNKFLEVIELLEKPKINEQKLGCIRDIFAKYKTRLNGLNIQSPFPNPIDRTINPGEYIHDIWKTSYSDISNIPLEHHLHFLKSSFSFLTQDEMKIVSIFMIRVDRFVIEKLNDLLTRSKVLSINSAFLSANRGEAVYSFSPFDSTHPLSQIINVLVNEISSTQIPENKNDNINKKVMVSINLINKWLKEFGIGDYFEINSDNNDGRIIPFVVKNGNKQTMPELGYGYSQVLPIILLSAIYNPTFISNPKNDIRLFISEPEIHLHPNLQSKLGDLFLDYVKNKGNLVLETHSEYLIRKIQYLVACGKLNPEQVAIYYFSDVDSDTDDDSRVKRIRIRKDGIMDDDFGSGFLDESTKLTIDLLNVQDIN